MRLSLLAELRARCHSDLHEMRDALARGDLAHVDHLSHRMIGAAGALEMHDVSRQARAINIKIRAGDVAAATDALDGLEATLDQWKDP